MSHHKSTPKTVLNAPTLDPVVVYPQGGLNRDERRGLVPVSAKRRLSAHGHRNAPFVGNVRRDLLGIAS